ncbi:MAG: hypothetical protein JWQ90_2641 [Hydrocarboniphaga sp.]|uniref:hypothetical protein n=1 Tax=Hydrocarboniphaga sp. TaxID=2033016 RepID=UPI00261EF6DE|nr:hypothetical protein [Hydrocarboniphaga sp.]MDB5970191.1 hypothetical protein [Hydrocarboniphaga sp.]
MNELGWFLIADLLGCLLIVLLLAALTSDRPGERRQTKASAKRRHTSAYAIRQA